MPMEMASAITMLPVRAGKETAMAMDLGVDLRADRETASEADVVGKKLRESLCEVSKRLSKLSNGIPIPFGGFVWCI